MRDLIPRSRGTSPAFNRDFEQSPFLMLHREMNRLLDDMWRNFDTPMSAARMPAMSQGWPNIEISDTEKEIKVTADLPGIDEKDVELTLADGVLTLKGEKRSETEDKDRQFSERYYGRFERRIPVGSEIEEGKVAASFHNGVLTVDLPKTAKAQAGAKHIAINGEKPGTTTH